jgi:hypothetical protein
VEVSRGRWEYGYTLPCQDAYEANGMKAGTYTRSNAYSSDWTYRP